MPGLGVPCRLILEFRQVPADVVRPLRTLVESFLRMRSRPNRGTAFGQKQSPNSRLPLSGESSHQPPALADVLTSDDRFRFRRPPDPPAHGQGEP